MASSSLEVKTVADLLAALTKDVRVNRLLETNQLELTRSGKDREGRPYEGSYAEPRQWALWSKREGYEQLISGPLAAALRSWGLEWGYKKSVKQLLRMLSSQTVEGTRDQMCTCGHWQGRHFDYRGMEHFECFEKSEGGARCGCRDFVSARI